MARVHSIATGEVIDTWRLSRFSMTLARYRAGTTIAAHDHSVASLQVVVSGSMVEIVGRRRFPLRTGCAIVKPARERHCDTYATDVDCLLVELPEHCMSHRSVVGEGTARAWSLNLIQEVRSQEPGWALVAEGLILEGLGRLERIRAFSTARPRWLDEVLSLARQQQSLGVIARAIGRHPSHVAREFRRHEGVSVGEYARRCRLELAARRLRSGEEPIAAVALTAGFCDQSHFSNAFRRLFGMTPGEYRRGKRSSHPFE
jgi:AraC family transcriptional regulator